MSYYGVIYTRSVTNIGVNPAPTVTNSQINISVANSGQIDYTYYKVNPYPTLPQTFNVSPAVNDYVPTSIGFVPTTLANVIAGTNDMQTDVYSLNQIDRYRNGSIVGPMIGTDSFFVAFKGFRDNDATILNDAFVPDNQEVFINDLYSAYYDVNKPCGNIYLMLAEYQDISNPHRVIYTNLKTGVQTILTLAENKLQQVPYVHPDNVDDGNSVKIQYRFVPVVGSPSWVTLNESIFYPKQECKYETVTCDFIGKYGVWKRIFFYKASYLNLEMTNQDYKVLDNTNTQRRIFNTNGNLSLKVNTDWVDEWFNEDLTELMLSDNIQIDGVPARLKTKSTELHKNINNKTINYTLEFDFNKDLIRK